MVQFHVKHLQSLSAQQLEEIIKLTCNAFHNDISHKAFLGGDWTLHSEFMRALIHATLLEGRLEVVTIGPGEVEEIASVAVWFGNGAQLFGTEEQRSLGYTEFFQKLSPEAQDWMAQVYPEDVTKLDKAAYTDEEIAKRWWCFCLATAPEYENRGYATSLVRGMYEKAKQERNFIGLATDSDLNRSKYLRMGFEERPGGSLYAPTGDFPVYFFSMGKLEAPLVEQTEVEDVQTRVQHGTSVAVVVD